MAIEFRCTQCSKLLRTGDDTAGKQAKCPGCGTVMTIPAGAAGAGGALPPLSNDNPFGAVGSQPPFPADSGNPYQSPNPFATIGAIPSHGAIVPGTLDLGDVLGRTWTLYKADFGMCLAAALIVLVLNIGANMVSNFVPIAGPIACLLFQIWIEIGLALFFLKKARGQHVEIVEVFAGWPYFGKVLLATLLIVAIVFGIVLVCVAPLALVGVAISKDMAVVLGVAGGLVAAVLICYVSLMLSQFRYLILDRNMGVIESLKTSKDLMEGNKLTLFLIGLVAGVAAVLLSILTCGIGYLIVLPYLAMMNAVIYLTITSQLTAEQMHRGPTA